MRLSLAQIVLSKITDYTDRNTCILFGDGAGAVVIGEVPEERGFKSFELGADGTGGPLLKIEGGGSRNPASQNFALTSVCIISTWLEPKCSNLPFASWGMQRMKRCAKQAGRKQTLICLFRTKPICELFNPHLNRLELSENKCMINLDKYGNMSAASIPVALAEAVEQGRLKEGDRLVLLALAADSLGAQRLWFGNCAKWTYYLSNNDDIAEGDPFLVWVK